MTDALNHLIGALREELQQYGEMLARLDEQQELVIRRAPDHLLQSTADVEAQTKVLQSVRQQRAERQGDVARALRLNDEAAFAEIVARLPKDYRPLVSALVQENNELLARVQQRSRQNHVLLSRSVEMMGRLLGALLPNGSTVYTDKGIVPGGTLSMPSLYQAVG